MTSTKIWQFRIPHSEFIARSSLLRHGTGQRRLDHEILRTPEGKSVVSGSHDRALKLWDITTAQLKLTLQGDSALLAVAVSADGRTIAAGYADGTVNVWQVP
jgi:WD40 repeat protein